MIDQYKDKILADVEIPEDVIEEYYDGHGESFMSEERVKLEILVVDSTEMAAEAYEKFKEGQPFDDLMEKFSILKERGLTGRTRWIPYKSLPQEVQFLIQGSEVGDILAPVKTKLWMIGMFKPGKRPRWNTSTSNQSSYNLQNKLERILDNFKAMLILMVTDI